MYSVTDIASWLFWSLRLIDTLTLYSALFAVPHTQGAQISHSFTCKLHHACLYLVSVHQMALPLTCDGVRLIAAYYSFIDPERVKGWVSLVGWPIADCLPTWSPVSCRSSAGQEKFAGQRPTLYHCATQHNYVNHIHSYLCPFWSIYSLWYTCHIICE